MGPSYMTDFGGRFDEKVLYSGDTLVIGLKFVIMEITVNILKTTT